MIDARTIVSHLMRAEQQTLNKAMQRALFQSSGKYSSKKLAKLGYPYAARRGGKNVPYGDPGRVNVQTGDFYLSWSQIKPRISGNSIKSTLTNPSPYANKLALGIPKRTIARPVIARIIPTTGYWRIIYLTRSIRNAVGQISSRNP